MVGKELHTPETYETTSLAEAAESKLREAAKVVKESVLAEVVAMGDSFPKVEVALPPSEAVDRQDIGAFVLGRRLPETDHITGIIVEDNSIDAYVGNYSAVLLTPTGMRRVRGSLVSIMFSPTHGHADIFPNRDGHSPDEDALWLSYGLKAARKVEQIKAQLASEEQA